MRGEASNLETMKRSCPRALAQIQGAMLEESRKHGQPVHVAPGLAARHSKNCALIMPQRFCLVYTRSGKRPRSLEKLTVGAGLPKYSLPDACTFFAFIRHDCNIFQMRNDFRQSAFLHSLINDGVQEMLPATLAWYPWLLGMTAMIKASTATSTRRSPQRQQRKVHATS